jgi:acyl carrier protein
MDGLPTRSQSMLDSKLQAVIEVVAKVLDVSVDDLGPESSMENTPSWDSMVHMTICLEFERRFGKSLDLDTIFTTTSVRELTGLVPA